MLELAREKKARDRDDLNRMYDLEFFQCDACTHDKKVLLILLSKLEQGKKISINISDIDEADTSATENSTGIAETKNNYRTTLETFCRLKMGVQIVKRPAFLFLCARLR